MRPLNVALGGRPAPNPRAQPKRGAGPARRGAGRRKPPPLWLRPALRYGAPALTALVIVGSGLWTWHSGTLAEAADAAKAAVANASAAAGLAVQQIDVQGRVMTPPKMLLAAVGITRGEPILFFDAEAARQRILRLGWVKNASVQRLLPGTILLHIVERQPFARWQIDGRTMLIDRDGAVLSDVDSASYRDLRRVVGPGAADHVGALFDMVTLEPALAARVRTAIRVRERRWDIELDNGITIRLPEHNPELAWHQLARLDREDRVLSKALAAIDLRLADRVVLQLTPEAAAMRKVPGKNT